MIILDTNILSEMMKQTPDSQVIQWLDRQNPLQLFITTISIAEIGYGLHALPAGNRRNALDNALDNAFENVVKEAFTQRILEFNQAAAWSYGQLMSQRKTLGKPLSILDGQIAAIAYTHQFAVATRNVKDFTDCNLVLINPFATV